MLGRSYRPAHEAIGAARERGNSGGRGRLHLLEALGGESCNHTQRVPHKAQNLAPMFGKQLRLVVGDNKMQTRERVYK